MVEGMERCDLKNWRGGKMTSQYLGNGKVKIWLDSGQLIQVEESDLDEIFKASIQFRDMEAEIELWKEDYKILESELSIVQNELDDYKNEEL